MTQIKMELDKPAPRHPTQVYKKSSIEMGIEWNDGCRSVIAFTELRYLCPCAACVNEMTGERTIQRELVSADVRPIEVAVVGRYALKIDWSDGHSTGMYAFDRLREICDDYKRQTGATCASGSCNCKHKE